MKNTQLSLMISFPMNIPLKTFFVSEVLLNLTHGFQRKFEVSVDGR